MSDTSFFSKESGHIKLWPYFWPFTFWGGAHSSRGGGKVSRGGAHPLAPPQKIRPCSEVPKVFQQLSEYAGGLPPGLRRVFRGAKTKGRNGVKWPTKIRWNLIQHDCHPQRNKWRGRHKIRIWNFTSGTVTHGPNSRPAWNRYKL